MNNRIVELLQRPQQIQLEDLPLLEKQIQQAPYLQFVRALYLYGIHQYQPEDYKNTLTTTAAYTTDKKILFQFINQQATQNRKENILEDTPVAIVDEKCINTDLDKPIVNAESYSTETNDLVEVDSVVYSVEEKKEEQEFAPKQENKSFRVSDNVTFSAPVVSTFTSNVGKTLPVHFESAEDQELIPIVKSDSNNIKPISEFISPTEATKVEAIEETEEILVEETAEEVEENINVTEIISATEATKVEIIAESEEILVEEIEKEIVEEAKSTEPAALSYEGIDDFLPNVKFEVPKNHSTFLNPPKFDKPKPKEIVMPTTFGNIKSEIKEELKVSNEDINFHNTMDFGPFSESIDLGNIGEKQAETMAATPSIIEEKKIEETSFVEEKIAVANNSWQPMHLDNNTPDALIGKEIKQETKQKEVLEKEIIQPTEVDVLPNIALDNNEIIEEVITDVTEDIRPIMNVSFFTDHVSQISKKEEKHEEIVETKEELSIAKEVVANITVADSNIGQFINTWQSWLKIDRKEVVVEDVEEIKSKAIDQFIENQPKISQLKEEVAFVVKEKKEDISHLMTETLVGLYVEQKLYSKAIKGYEILTGKFPEKTDYYKQLIDEVKEMRKPF